jgi:hypothetical protein
MVCKTLYTFVLLGVFLTTVEAFTIRDLAANSLQKVFLAPPHDIPHATEGSMQLLTSVLPTSELTLKATFFFKLDQQTHEQNIAMILTLVFLAASARFLWRGLSLTTPDIVGKSRPLQVFCRIHPIAVAALVMAATRLAWMEGVDPPLHVPWVYIARMISSFLLVLCLGLFGGDNAAVPVLTASVSGGSWALLAASAESVGPFLHWGLFMTGSCSMLLVSKVLEDLPDVQNRREKLRPIIDLSLFSSVLYIAFWLAIEGCVIPPITKTVLDGVVDLLFVCGCGHLLLKREEALAAR